MPARQSAPCLKCCRIVEPREVAFVTELRLRPVGIEDWERSPQASVSICVCCADQMANGDEPPARTRPLDHVVYELLRDLIANDFTYQLHKWIALRKEMGLPVPALGDPKILRAWSTLKSTMALPEIQTIEAGEGKPGLVKAG